MLHYEVNFFPKTRYDIWKYYSFTSKSIFNRSNIFFLFREIVKLISLAFSSIYIDELITYLEIPERVLGKKLTSWCNITYQIY